MTVIMNVATFNVTNQFKQYCLINDINSLKINIDNLEKIDKVAYQEIIETH